MIEEDTQRPSLLEETTKTSARMRPNESRITRLQRHDLLSLIGWLIDQLESVRAIRANDYRPNELNYRRLNRSQAAGPPIILTIISNAEL